MGIIARSPTRVDLAGGTLDIMPLTHILKEKKTSNFGVSLFAEVRIKPSGNDSYSLKSHDQKLHVNGNWDALIADTRLPWLAKILGHFWKPDFPALDIEVQAKSPAGAGLGGSSCLGICMASALSKAREDIGKGLNLEEKRFVQTVQDLETSLIRVPTGCQDYWGGLRGGINIISYPPGEVQVETLRSDRVPEIDDLLMLFYSGVSRASGSNNWAIFKKAFDGDKDTLLILDEIASVSLVLAEEISKSRWAEVFKLSAMEWELGKRLWADIETPETQKIAKAAATGGAMFSRICGAGGGGVMAVFSEKKNHSKIRDLVSDSGGTYLDAKIAWDGTTIEGKLYE